MRDVYLRMVEVLQESHREKSLRLFGGFLAGQFETLDKILCTLQYGGSAPLKRRFLDTC